MPAELGIGALAARSGRSAHTIRWYEAQGLLPGVTRDGGGRRRYREEHVAWLELMARLRTTGMSIAQMRQYTRLVQQGHKTLQQRHALLMAHREKVRDALADWRLALGLIESKLDFYQNWIASGRRPAAPDGSRQAIRPQPLPGKRRGG